MGATDMKVRCPAGNVYDATVHAECPCPSCWADRSSLQLAPKVGSSGTVSEQPWEELSPQTARPMPESGIEDVAITPLPAESGEVVDHIPRVNGSPSRWRLAVGLGCFFLIAVAGYYGASFWLKARADHQIEALFSRLQVALGSATHGDVEFDPWSGTVSIRDIAIQAKAPSPVLMKIGQLVITGIPIIPSSDLSVGGVDGSELELTMQGDTLRADNLKAGRISLTPAAFSEFTKVWNELARLPAPVQMKSVLDKVAAGLEGTKIDSIELKATTLRIKNAPTARLAVAAIRGLNNGRLTEYALEGLADDSPQHDKFSVQRLAINGVDLPALLRKPPQFDGSSRPFAKEQVDQLLSVFHGFEIRGLIASNRSIAQLDQIELFQASWGEFVGPIPTNIRVAAKVRFPATIFVDPGLIKTLQDRGLGYVSLTTSVRGEWNEKARTFALTPVVLELSDLFNASANLSISNVERETFVADSTKLPIAAAELQVGPIELSITDTGVVAFVVANTARISGISVEAARKATLEQWAKRVGTQAQSSRDIQAFSDAVGRFIATRDATLRVRLVPKGQLKVLQILDLWKLDPIAALSKFNVGVDVNR